MNPYRIRRATTDDLEHLVGLWQSLDMPALELEKVFTQFQLAQDSDGKIVGAIAMHIEGTDGRIHSETLPDFALSDVLRPLFWDRLQSVARNNGLFRVWTDEGAPFWKKEVGFAPVSEAQLKQLPHTFGQPHPGWTMLQLRSESAAPEALEKQLEAVFTAQMLERQASVRQAEAWARQGHAIKTIATVISLLLFLAGIVALVWVLKS